MRATHCTVIKSREFKFNIQQYNINMFVCIYKQGKGLARPLDFFLPCQPLPCPFALGRPCPCLIFWFFVVVMLLFHKTSVFFLSFRSQPPLLIFIIFVKPDSLSARPYFYDPHTTAQRAIHILSTNHNKSIY